MYIGFEVKLVRKLQLGSCTAIYTGIIILFLNSLHVDVYYIVKTFDQACSLLAVLPIIIRIVSRTVV